MFFFIWQESRANIRAVTRERYTAITNLLNSHGITLNWNIEDSAVLPMHTIRMEPFDFNVMHEMFLEMSNLGFPGISETENNSVIFEADRDSLRANSTASITSLAEAEAVAFIFLHEMEARSGITLNFRIESTSTVYNEYGEINYVLRFVSFFNDMPVVTNVAVFTVGYYGIEHKRIFLASTIELSDGTQNIRAADEALLTVMQVLLCPIRYDDVQSIIITRHDMVYYYIQNNNRITTAWPAHRFFMVITKDVGGEPVNLTVSKFIDAATNTDVTGELFDERWR